MAAMTGMPRLSRRLPLPAPCPLSGKPDIEPKAADCPHAFPSALKIRRGAVPARCDDDRGIGITGSAVISLAK
jgi:hypothetical protein